MIGLVLAGGRSRRMGREKSALNCHGQPQARHLAALLAPYAQTVLVSVRREQAEEAHLADCALIFDQAGVDSPLSGILVGLQAHPGQPLLVAAVDMPGIGPKAVEALLARRDPHALVTCFESPGKGGPDPLFALWEPAACAPIEAALRDAKGHLCPRAFLRGRPVRVISGAVPPEVLANLNTPEEYAAWNAARA